MGKNKNKNNSKKMKSKPYKITPKEVFVDPIPDNEPDGRARLEELRFYSGRN